jgi:hypothetical protein
VQKKLKDIEKQKRELLKKLHAKEDSTEPPETIGQKAKAMLTATYDFFKDLFLKIGSTINKGLEKAAQIGEQKKEKTEVKPVKEIKKEPKKIEAPEELEELEEEEKIKS